MTAPLTQRRTFLVVDDDEDIRSICRRFLTRDGIDVVEARSLDEARATMAKVRFDAILSDRNIGDDRGEDLLAQASSLQPEAMRLLMSGTRAPIDMSAVDGFILKGMNFIADLKRLGEKAPPTRGMRP